jgi:polysaccharide export outer membrane protein
MRLLLVLAAIIVVGAAGCASSPDIRIPAAPAAGGGYLIQPGDLLQVTVWKEADLTGEVLVRSDGGLSFPLVGDLMASGKTVEALRDEFTKRLKNYIPDPVVTIATKQMGGNQIYVIGRVQRPGGYPFVKPLDVMEALSLAGGGTPFASLNSIIIIRRENGQQRTIPFRYSDVASGKKLSQNIVLESGDTVVVP